MKPISLEPEVLVKIDGNRFPADYVAGRKDAVDAAIARWRNTNPADWDEVERNQKGWRVYWAWPDA